MPYITKEARINMDNAQWPETTGELNYQLTMVCLDYLAHKLTINKSNTYSNYNDVIGALECCKLEMYRRVIAPYEDMKKEANGDVY